MGWLTYLNEALAHPNCWRNHEFLRCRRVINTLSLLVFGVNEQRWTTE